MITIYDIAAKAGVSAMTVSRVINNTGRISEKTRKRVRKVMEELHYIPNMLARSLVSQKTHLLSLLITDITNPFYTTLARGAEDAAKKAGYRLLFANSDEDYAKEKDYIDMILTTRVDGVLLAPTGDHSLENLNQLRKHHIPFVVLDREIPGIDVDVVLGDSKAGARNLVEHLIRLGHRRIALVNGLQDVSTARLRYTGYEEAHRLSGLQLDESLIVHLGYRDFHDDSALDQLFQLEQPPTAIFAANNMLAVGVIQSLRARGFHVPGDISVVCFDDFGPAGAINPFLTVASQPAYQFGQLGMQLLIERLESENNYEFRKIMLPSQLIVRSSTLPLSP
ncbi:LacI family DNA-binding transcriptional regulator [Paenibacillus qinlingensis]|uniref:LacI family DNA-binding transcriptional regulator n=1 Tax=Paenibacillus qinlingensis TaxID=1837343 RepID=UPI0015668234|nr:LacI family DNA-binding transcriptional regulator [Paenibacillus qinlingensis]NQX63370.1 LacI family DNA-binding transcriptional regulator [Paenibacillus qinlingensis]